MALDTGVSSLFTEEYRRFWQGIRDLDPETRQAWAVSYGRRGLKPGETPTVTIPGWDDVVRLGPRYPITRAETLEYFAAKREQRPPQLSQEAIRAIESREQFMESIRTSTSPEYLRGWGDILTALDNVQDFTATISALGRLVVWAAPRVAGRFVPVLGVVVLASDLLNILGLLGTLAIPFYTALCAGPEAALVAGVPGFIFKKALKQETWKGMLHNPFARLGMLRLRPAMRITDGVSKTLGLSALRLERAQAWGGLPSFSNLLEAGQTSQSLWGYGLSLGGLVGTAYESAFATERFLRGEYTRVNPTPFTDSLRRLFGSRLGALSNPQLEDHQRAAGVLASAGKLQQVQDVLPDEVHLLTLTALQTAIPMLEHFARGVEWQPIFADAFEQTWAPVIQDELVTTVILDAHGLSGERPMLHALPGNPARIRGDEYVATLGPRVIEATTEWLAERRNTPEGVFAGTLIVQTAESLWHFLTGSDQAIRWELSTDQRLLASLSEEGFVVNIQQPQESIWRFWKSARAELERRGDTRLDGATWRRLATAQGLTLITLLPPEAAWPPEWQAWLAAGPEGRLVSP